MDLRVGLQVGDVAKSGLLGQASGVFEHRCRHIDAQDASGDGGPAGISRGLAGAAADVEHPVTPADLGGGPEASPQAAQLFGHPVAVPDRALGGAPRGPRPRLGTRRECGRR
jgi:hypothetical protein